VFNFAEPGAPDAAFLIRDNPEDPQLTDLVKAGYMIRTRDGGARKAEEAKASGAHLVSTDYPAGLPQAETGYELSFGDGRSMRCNPVTAPADCALSGER